MIRFRIGEKTERKSSLSLLRLREAGRSSKETGAWKTSPVLEQTARQGPTHTLPISACLQKPKQKKKKINS
jgi:hypothetical protein